jgi:hypothetical protein
MGASKRMDKDKSIDASNIRATTERRNTCNSIGANNSEDKSKTMDASNSRAKNK